MSSFRYDKMYVHILDKGNYPSKTQAKSYLGHVLHLILTRSVALQLRLL